MITGKYSGSDSVQLHCESVIRVLVVVEQWSPRFRFEVPDLFETGCRCPELVISCVQRISKRKE